MLIGQQFDSPRIFGDGRPQHADRLQCRGILRHESCSLKSAACKDVAARCAALVKAHGNSAPQSHWIS